MFSDMWNPEKIWHQKLINLLTLPISCSHVTLGNPKNHITTLLIRTSDYLRYLRIKQTVTVAVNLPTISEMLPHYCVKCRTCSSDWRYVVFFQFLVALKKTGCVVWQRECQTSNFTASVQSYHLLYGHTLPVIFAIVRSHRPPCLAETQPMSQQAAAAARPYRGLVLNKQAPA